MKKFIFSLATLSVLGIGVLQAVPYNIDKAHSSIDFKVSHLLVSNVKGSFSSFSGEIDINPETKVINKLEGEIDISSIDTGNKDRDDHLMAEKYLDTNKYPKGVLKMTKFSKNKKGVKVEADLTIKGVTKKVVFKGDIKGPVEHPMTKKQVLGLELSSKINRKDFGIAADTPSATMGDQIHITINLELASN